MSLRDWFAGQALVGFCYNERRGAISVAKVVYEIADAVMAERDK
jgi:hypothetical protein